MKLFKSLLVAPATLGLLAPLSAAANEVNLNDISNYSKSNSELSANEFEFNSPQDAILISGGEGLVETSADSFSSTTSFFNKASITLTKLINFKCARV